MRILYVHLYNADYGMGGAEKVVYDLAAAMKKTFGHEVVCALNPSKLGEKLEEAGISVSPIAWSKTRTLQTLVSLAKTTAAFKPHVIHSHHRYTTFLLDLFFRNRYPVIHTEHVLRQDKKILFRPGTLVTAVHPTVAENLHSWFGVPKEKIHTISNAVSRPAARPEVLDRLKARYPRGDGQIYALCTGRLEEQKGHVYLIDALAQLPLDLAGRLTVFLAGDGSLETELRDRVRAKGLENRVVFLGHTEEIPEYLEFCDFFVLPSLFEGMPLSVMEAFSAGLPALATDIPGTREVVDASCGILVPSRDPAALAAGLKQILEHEDRIKSMGEKAFDKWQREYSFDRMITAYNDLYGRLAGAGGN